VAAPRTTRGARAAAGPFPPVTARDLATMRGDVTEAITRRPWAWLVPDADKPAVIGFDIGASSACCLLTPGQPPTISAKNTDGITDSWVDWVDRWVDLAAGQTTHHHRSVSTIVAIEDAFLARGKLANPHVHARLCRYVGAIAAIATARGLPSYRVPAAAWQTAIFGQKTRRDQGKKLSAEIARQTVSRDIVSEHEADAALLATFVYGPSGGGR